jgi:hypothetical protein
LGRLLSDNINPQAIDVMVYIRSTVGNLTIIGSHVDYWNRETSPLALAREPSLDEMARVLRDARREV